jgi:hypothetical protein
MDNNTAAENELPIYAGEVWIASVWDDRTEAGCDAADANAALIASAPDLAAEVTRLRDALRDCVEIADLLRARETALRAALLEALNDCTASACDANRTTLANAASAACADKLRAALEVMP